jgi:hypothetical protein
MTVYTPRNAKLLKVGSRWHYSRRKNVQVEVVGVRGTWIRYKKQDGTHNECTAWGFLNVYRPMEADKVK